ncbi:hypothetical protein GBAR_LOCUS22154 [Geodia barretti]|uniref:Uncharacterized protein n=1 Tax=Geodia barretti TaxID=519541 RepID=A0AA35T3P6_GEOBA|nr:hypothetical protein GBAR_LOCUS22154 [Geodia barretti]
MRPAVGSKFGCLRRAPATTLFRRRKRETTADEPHPDGAGAAHHLHCRPACARAQAPRHQAQPPGSDRLYLRRAPDVRARRPHPQGPHGLWRGDPHVGRRDAGRAGADSGDPCRGGVPGRRQAHHRAPADPPGHGGEPAQPPRRRDHHAGRGDRAERGPEDRIGHGHQHRRPPGADRQPLPLLRDQPGARLRPGGDLRHAPRHPVRHCRALRAGAGEGGRAGGNRRPRPGHRLQQPHRGHDRFARSQGSGDRPRESGRLPGSVGRW